MNWQPRLPKEIEAESFRRIEAQVGAHHLPPEVWQVVRRMIHTTADLDYLAAARVHPAGHRRRGGSPAPGPPGGHRHPHVAGGYLQRPPGPPGGETLLPDGRPGGGSRGGPARDHPGRGGHGAALPRLAGGIVAIGNAPTALLRLLELLEAGAPPPALVVGLPVGFVNAAESKDALGRQHCPFITALGPKGGSAVAAAVINALAIMALEEIPS